MQAFWQDLRHGIRLLARKPGFAVIAMVTLALGIGGATAIFSVVDGVLLRPLPYPHPERIVRLFEVTARRPAAGWADLNFEDVRKQVGAIEGMAEFRSDLEPVAGGSQPTLVTVAAVSHDFFKVMGVYPFLGRTFPADQLHPGGTPMVIVSYGFWRRFLGGAPDFAARHLNLSGHDVTIMGVMPPGFSYPNGADIWFPRELAPTSAYRISHLWMAVGRLKPGVTLAAAQAQASAVARRLKQEYGETTNMTGIEVVRLGDQIVGNARPALLALVGAVGLLLLVACANVANLLLAQAAERQQELAVRVAVGANRGHLVGQFVAESLLLSGGASLIGLPVSVWGVRALVAMDSAQLPRAADVRLHPEVLVFAAAMAVLTAVGLGLVTAIRAAGGDVQECLKGSDRTQTGNRSSHRLRMVLLGAQVAVTLVLLAGAMLLGRSLFGLLEVRSGFEPRHVLAIDLLDVWPETPTEKTHLVNVLQSLVDRLRAVPGVEDAGVVSSLPLSGLARHGGYMVLTPNQTFSHMKDYGRAYIELQHDPSRTGHSEYLVASGGYFRTMRIPLLRGRLFRPSDGPDAPNVAIVSRAFARAQWPGKNPLGKRIEFGNMDGDLSPFTIVGEVGDVRDRGLYATPPPMFYSDYRQRSANDFSVVARSARPAADLVPLARQIEQSLEPDLPVRFQTMSQIVSASTANRRFSLVLLAVFALTALVVALMGIYGSAAYLVSQRKKEIGIRVALGAEAGDVVRMIAGEGLRVILAGAVVGVGGAVAFSRLLESLLYGVTATDPLTFAAVALLIVATGFLATYLPARRAARVDPVAALRQ